MSAALITQLIIALGPIAFKLIPELAGLWNKNELTVEEVTTFCNRSQKTYEQYIAEAKAKVIAVAPAVA